MAVELEQLRIFLALCETRSFTAAAKKLYKSHSAVSRCLGALERELGTQLAVRDRHSFALTPAGERLREEAAPLLAAAEALPQRIAGRKETKEAQG